MSVMGMVTIAILYRWLTVTEIGFWIFFTSTVALIDTFRSGFLTTAFIKFYAGSSPERMAEVAGSGWYLSTLITGGLILLNIPAFIALHWIDHTGVELFLKWFGITYICTLPMFMSTCIVQSEQRFDRFLLIRVVNQGSFILCILALIFLKQVTLTNVLYANLASSLLTSLVAIFSGWARIGTWRKRSKSTTAELYHFGKYSVGTNISANLFRSSDTYIITFMLGPAALAIYNLGQRLIEVVEIPMRSFAATGMPILSAAFNQEKKEEVIYTMKKYAGMLTVALIPVAIVAVLLADYLILLIGGSQYAGTEAANVFRLFMSFALLYPVDRFLALTLDVIHQPRINFYKVLVMLAVNVGMDFAGISIFGNIYGVALASLFPLIVGIAVAYYYLRKYIPFTLGSILTTGYRECITLVRSGFSTFRY